MKVFFFLFIFLFIQCNSQIKENPIYLINNTHPYLLSTNDDDYYYVMTEESNLIINKESGIIVNTSNNPFISLNYFYIKDNLYNNYIYSHSLKKYYQIIYKPFFDYEELPVIIEPEEDPDVLTIVGSIPHENYFIIYGYTTNNLLFSHI